MRWSAPETVQGFAKSPPNEVLMGYAETLRQPPAEAVALDLGCGAGRNAVPLARAGWHVIGTDNSQPMLYAAATRRTSERLEARLEFVHAEMDYLPVADGFADLVIAHGIWNLAASGAQFRRAVREAARAARPGAGLFVFTFSRNTLPPQLLPIAGETFVFTEFAGEPQCFLTAEQLTGELAAAGFEPDGAVPLRELNRPAGPVRTIAGPVIWEGSFRRAAG
jgi:SAM-dependent methyltransferase